MQYLEKPMARNSQVAYKISKKYIIFGSLDDSNVWMNETKTEKTTETINKYQEQSCIALFRSTTSNISHTFYKKRCNKSRVRINRMRIYIIWQKKIIQVWWLTLISIGHRLSWLDQREESWGIWRRSMARTGSNNSL